MAPACHLVAFFDAARQQQVGKAVGFYIKFTPGQLLAERAAAVGFDQRILAPRDVGNVLDLGIDLDQRDLVLEVGGVSGEKLGDRHYTFSFNI